VTAIANATTIAGATLAHVAGPVGVAATAVGAAAVAGVGMATRARASRRSAVQQSKTIRASESVVGLRRGGPLFGGRGGSLLGGSPTGRAGRPPRAASGDGPSKRGLSLPRLPKLPKLGGPDVRPSGDGSSRRTGSSPRTGGSDGGGGRLPRAARDVADSLRKIRARAADRRAAGPRLGQAIRAATQPAAGGRMPTGWQAAAAARRNVTGSAPLTRRGFIRRHAAGLAAGGIAGTIAWWRARRRRKAAQKAREAKRKRVGQRRKTPVATTVRGQTPEQAKRPLPAPRPVRRRITMIGGQPASGGSMSRAMLELSEEFYAAALRDRPEGMLQVVATAHRLGQITENFAKAMKVIFDRSMEYPLHPTIKEMYEALATAQAAVVKAAEQIGPAIERIHKKRLEELRNPTVGGDQSMWDVTKNRTAA
jgi:hypothetical protein